MEECHGLAMDTLCLAELQPLCSFYSRWLFRKSERLLLQMNNVFYVHQLSALLRILPNVCADNLSIALVYVALSNFEFVCMCDRLCICMQCSAPGSENMCNTKFRIQKYRVL